MGDLNKRRGRVMNMNAENGYQEIDADLPYLELYGYNTQLRSMTSGSGTFSYELPGMNKHLRMWQQEK